MSLASPFTTLRPKNVERKRLPVHQQNCNIFEIFPDVQFYDYTKIPRRNVPANYHLTFSYSGVAEFQPVVEKQLEHKPDTNLAVVFGSELPATFYGREVVNGDASDIRFLDDHFVVVGLTAKGKAKTDRSGFVVTTGA